MAKPLINKYSENSKFSHVFHMFVGLTMCLVFQNEHCV